MTALIQKFNTILGQTEENQQTRTYLLQLLISLAVTFLAEFYLIKFQDYHQVTTQTIIGKSLWVFFATMLALEFKYKKIGFYKYAFVYLSLLLSVNFFIPFIIRNFLFIPLDSRLYLHSLNNDFLLFVNNFGIVAPVILIWVHTFKKKFISVWKLLTITLLVTILAMINPATESMRSLFAAFNIQYSILNVIETLFCTSLVFPFWLVLIEASTSNKPINFKKVILAFIMITYAFLYLISPVFGTYSMSDFSYAISICMFFAYFALKSNIKLLEQVFLVSPFKYVLFALSIIGIIESDSSIFVMHSIVLFLFSCFLIKYSLSKTYISKFKEVHCE